MAPVANHASEELVAEAARIICEESVLDYRSAKTKAAQRLGLGSRTALPENARIEAAVIDYQRVFGGSDYANHLIALRQAAVSAMRLLVEFQPRLVGGAVSGAITAAHRVQLHGFAEKAEALDLFLEHRGIPFEQGERSYRYPDGCEEPVPLARFEAGEIGIDVAMFSIDDQRRAPLSPTNGLAMKRLALPEVEALARFTAARILLAPEKR
jgi:hypothetical protein